MRVHADCDNEAELFRLAFGMHLFDDGNYFPASRGKYTLEPLKVGRSSLACAGVDGILDITLKELEFRGHGELGLRERVGAADVFSVFESGAPIPAAADIRLARFSVCLFRDAKKTRMFTIRPSNFTAFPRDDDAIPLHVWLDERQFVIRIARRFPQMDNGLWNTLERLADGHPPAAVLAEWQRLADGEFAGVRPFLRLTNRLARDYPCLGEPDCGCRHELNPIDETRWVAKCQCGMGDCPPARLTPGDLLIHELDAVRFGSVVARILGFEPADNPGVLYLAPKCRMVGSCAVTRVPVRRFAQANRNCCQIWRDWRATARNLHCVVADIRAPNRNDQLIFAADELPFHSAVALYRVG